MSLNRTQCFHYIISSYWNGMVHLGRHLSIWLLLRTAKHPTLNPKYTKNENVEQNVCLFVSCCCCYLSSMALFHFCEYWQRSPFICFFFFLIKMKRTIASILQWTVFYYYYFRFSTENTTHKMKYIKTVFYKSWIHVRMRCDQL